jgi:ribosome modulation factor
MPLYIAERSDVLPGYAEGIAAFLLGKGIDANPFSWREEATKRQNWHAGWLETRQARSNAFYSLVA